MTWFSEAERHAMLRRMRVWLGCFSLSVTLCYSACSGDSFRADHTGGDPTPGQAGNASGSSGSEGGNPSDGGGASADGPGGAAAGPSAGGTPDSGASGSGTEPDGGYTLMTLIDDMEDGDSGILPTNGDWYILRDSSAGVITPPHGVPFVMTALVPPRGPSQQAVQVEVSGFQGWGAAVGFDFEYVDQQRQPYDLGGARALRFWARASQSAMLELQVPNADTDPLGERCSGTEGDNACYAHFRKAFAVGDEWREVTVPFADLRQEGVGRRAPSFDAQHVFSVFFVIGPKRELTVTIDDVALLK